MSRYYNEDDDFQDENLFPDTFGDDDDDDDDEMSEEMMEKQTALEKKQLELAQLDLNQQLLFKAMKFAEKYPYWKTKSRGAKLKIVAETYRTLKSLLTEEEKKE